MSDVELLSKLPPSLGWTVVAGLLLWVIRSGILKTQNDLNQYKAGGVFASGMDSLQKRVDQMDSRILRLERDKAKLVAFCTRVLTHFSGCGNCLREDGSRASLQAEYEVLMADINKSDEVLVK